MFECQVSLLSMACIFKPAQLLIAFQPQVTDIIIHMRKNDGLENKKKNVFFVFSHLGGSVLLTGVRESGSISGRLPDNQGGCTCMKIWHLIRGYTVCINYKNVWINENIIQNKPDTLLIGKIIYHHEKTCLCHMQTTKVQISLRIHAVWSAPLLLLPKFQASS